MDGLIWVQLLVWGGAALTLTGVVLLVWCIRLAIRARGATIDEDARRARLQRVVTINLGALAVSGIGLMMVVAGVMLV